MLVLVPHTFFAVQGFSAKLPLLLTAILDRLTHTAFSIGDEADADHHGTTRPVPSDSQFARLHAMLSKEYANALLDVSTKVIPSCSYRSSAFRAGCACRHAMSNCNGCAITNAASRSNDAPLP